MTSKRLSHEEHLELLFRVSQHLEQSLDLRDVIEPTVQVLAERMGLEWAVLTLLDRQTEEVHIEAAFGLSPQARRRGRYKLGEGITGQVAATGEARVVRRIAEAGDFLGRTGAKARAADLGFVCVPIKLGAEVVGTLGACAQAPDDAELEQHLRALSTVAAMLAQAVRLRQEAQEAHRQLVDENDRLRRALEDRFRPSNIIGTSKAMREVYDMVARVCKSDATVLIRGESGVGKELVAQAIHYSSLRAKNPFVRVNCAALPSDLLESELFGHERGAFTGAHRQRKGRFELAHNGTLFLDEVGEFPMTTQVLLLRVLQEKEFERVGSNETIQANVRLIAATNRDLEALVHEGRFREDLYYRLNVYPIRVPSLYERKTDIPLLTDFFIEKYARANNKNIRRVSTAAIDMLMAYHWPGNVRELENCIERASLLADDEVIHSHHLPPTLQTAEATGTVAQGTLQESLDCLERDLIVDALKVSRGNMAESARRLGISERVMGLRVRRYGIDWRRFRQNRNREGMPSPSF